MSVSTVATQQARYRARVQPYLTCAHGPRTIYHTVPGYFFYPPIEKGSCDNIASSTCVSKSEEQRSKCVLVHRYINGRWKKQGYQVVRYLHHISCHGTQRRSMCPRGQYFDRSTCTCKCIRKTCPSNTRQNPTSCWCECTPTACPIDHVFHTYQCRCMHKYA